MRLLKGGDDKKDDPNSDLLGIILILGFCIEHGINRNITMQIQPTLKSSAADFAALALKYDENEVS
jgi:hypothetical protein